MMHYNIKYNLLLKMNDLDGTFWINPKEEKVYQREDGNWQQKDFEKERMNVPILAERHLSRVVEIKQLIEDLQTEQKEIYSELNKFYSDGHLDYLKSSSGSITYKNTQFIHVKGRVTYDYSTDPDIKQKQLELRQLKKCAEAIGILESKQSPDTWRIKEVEVQQ